MSLYMKVEYWKVNNCLIKKTVKLTTGQVPTQIFWYHIYKHYNTLNDGWVIDAYVLCNGNHKFNTLQKASGVVATLLFN